MRRCAFHSVFCALYGSFKNCAAVFSATPAAGMRSFAPPAIAFPPDGARIAFLDAVYNFDGATHSAKLLEWLHGDPHRMLVSLAYDDREIMLDGKKVVSDSGGTWRATDRMLRAFTAAGVRAAAVAPALRLNVRIRAA